KMIETDNYGLISDQLYLVPFIRRYASFLEMDPEEIASRFVREVQHAESNIVRISEPLTVARKRARFGSIRRFLFSLMVILLAMPVAELAWRHAWRLRRIVGPRAAVSPATQPTVAPQPSIAAQPSPVGG